jgi:hypothetical protein
MGMQTGSANPEDRNFALILLVNRDLLPEDAQKQAMDSRK